MDDTRQGFLLNHPDRKTCRECGQVYYSAGGHMERCHGPVEEPCECPPGWLHRPDCHLVTGEETDA